MSWDWLIRERWTMVQVCVLGSMLLLFGGSVLQKLYEADELLLEDARYVARDWTASLFHQRYLMSPLLNGEPLSLNSEIHIRTLARTQDIDHLQIYGPHGDTLLGSNLVNVPGTPSLSSVSPETMSRVLSGELVAKMRKSGPNGNDVHVHALVPYFEDGEVAAIVSMDLDRSVRAELIHEFADSGLILMTLVTLMGLGNMVYTGLLIGEKRRSNARIQHLALHDPLTGIVNRNGFNLQLENAVKGSRQGDGAIALHVLDVDNFKTINDALGHDAGDKLLVEVSRVLRESVRSQDTVARLGGDEFAVIQVGVGTTEQAEKLAHRINRRVRAISDLGSVPVSASVSIGVALSPNHTSDVEAIQKFADVALYRSKAAGRNTHTVFESGMDAHLHARNRLRIMLRRATEKNGFELHYQPVHGAEGGLLTGFEALARLPDGEGGYISPGEFLPVADEMGLSVRLGDWVLEAACRAAAEWPSSLAISVNLSPRQFEADLVGAVRHALDTSGLPANRLQLEITEGLFVRSPSRVGEQLTRLKAMGVRVVMDDFGAGYTAISCLWKFPFDKIKVDGACFRQLGDSPEQQEVLRSIISMSRAMSVEVTAEGIETEGQRDFACTAGYDELQGFFYHRPMPPGRVLDYIAGHPAGALQSDDGEDSDDLPNTAAVA